MKRILMEYLIGLKHSQAGGLKRETVTTNLKADTEYWRTCIDSDESLSPEQKLELNKAVNVHEQDILQQQFNRNMEKQKAKK